MKPMRPYFRNLKDCSKFFVSQNNQLNTTLSTTGSGWGVQHPICSLYNFLQVCRLQVKL